MLRLVPNLRWTVWSVTDDKWGNSTGYEDGRLLEGGYFSYQNGMDILVDVAAEDPGADLKFRLYKVPEISGSVSALIAAGILLTLRRARSNGAQRAGAGVLGRGTGRHF